MPKIKWHNVNSATGTLYPVISSQENGPEREREIIFTFLIENIICGVYVVDDKTHN